LEILDKLEDILTVKNAEIKKQNGPLKNQTFLITGKLDGISRAEAKSLIEENSGVTVSSVSSKLNYLIVGDVKPTKKKVNKAKEMKIKIIFEKEWNKILDS